MTKLYLFLLTSLICTLGCKVGDYYDGYHDLSKAEDFIGLHQYDSAEFYLRKTLALSEMFSGYIYLAQVKAHKGEYFRAREYIDSADYYCPSFDADYLNNRGFVQNLIGDYDDAYVSLSNSVALDPEMAYAHCNLGRTYYHLADMKLAESHLQEALKQDPENPYAYHNMALVKAAKGDTLDACNLVMTAIQKNESFPTPIGKELKINHSIFCQ